MSDAESVVDVDALANRSAFERDILWVLSNEGEQKGVDIRLSLEEYYEKPVNHGSSTRTSTTSSTPASWRKGRSTAGRTATR